jgi:hypothetical protein
MNAKLIILSLLLASLVSCKKDSTVDPGDPPLPGDTPIVSISTGNQYNIHYGDITGIVYTDWFTKTTVLRDTAINGKIYFIFSTREIVRSTATSVVQWSGLSESVLYRFDVKVGDSISYQGMQLKITSIATDTVFVGTQKIIEASYASLQSDTTMSITFATKFGLLSTRKSIPNRPWSTSLVGAKIDTIKYGVM